MDETQRYVERRTVADLRAAHEHAAHLRRRIEALMEQIAESEDSVAEVYEEAARVRPHAAERLQEAARRAREFAAREREGLRHADPGSGTSVEEETAGRRASWDGVATAEG